MNKKGFEMSFTWIFSIIAGAAILFLAIYAASQFIKTHGQEIDTQTSVKLAILLDPLETSLESGKRSIIDFGANTKIYNDKCYTYGNFGEQSIGILTSQGRNARPSYGKPQYNKHIFSQNIEEGKEFSVFSKPFALPFKVSDLIFFSGREYCFVQTPESIREELEGLGIMNVNFTESKASCKDGSQKVCFGQSSGCEIAVYGNNYDFSSGYLIKEGKTLYFTDSLIYGAIFSSPSVYECNVKRLSLRLANLGEVYLDKIKILDNINCNSLMDSSLNEIITLARNLNSSQQLFVIKEKADETEKINEAAECKVY